MEGQLLGMCLISASCVDAQREMKLQSARSRRRQLQLRIPAQAMVYRTLHLPWSAVTLSAWKNRIPCGVLKDHVGEYDLLCPIQLTAAASAAPRVRSLIS